MIKRVSSICLFVSVGLGLVTACGSDGDGGGAPIAAAPTSTAPSQTGFDAGPCATNSQCSGGQACVGGVCSMCSVNTQCDPGQTCTAGICALGDAGGLGDAPAVCLVVGATNPVGSIWGNGTAAAPPGFGPAALGAMGKAAGDNACIGLYGAGARACTWEDIKQSEGCPALATLKASTDSAWMHRTGAETSPTAVTDPPGGVPAAPAKGGRCNDWTYGTNHAFDGEWIEFGGGIMKGHFDSDTVDDGPNPPSGASTHAVAGLLQCNEVLRRVVCCK